MQYALKLVDKILGLFLCFAMLVGSFSLSRAKAPEAPIDNKELHLEVDKSYANFKNYPVTRAAGYYIYQRPLSSGESAAWTECVSRYSNLFSSEVTRIGLVFGYNDYQSDHHRPGDLQMKQELIQRMTAPCPQGAAENNEFLCGFYPHFRLSDTFMKIIYNAYGQTRWIWLTVVASAINTLNVDEMSESEKKEQQIASDYAESTFKNALSNFDGVIYIGHSRDGGGPDFNPPVLIHDHVDYNYYRKKKAGLQMMLAALAKRSDGGPRLIIMDSCSSDLHFKNYLRAAAPKSALFLSQGVSYESDYAYLTFGYLNALVGQVCEPAFSEMVDPVQVTKTSAFKFYNF